MPLYGNELTVEQSPFEAGLGRVVKFEKPGDFVGRAALERRAEADVPRVRVGLKGAGRRAPRHGYAVAGPATPKSARSPAARCRRRSVTRSPWRTSIAAYAEPGTELSVDIRGRIEPVEVVALPFYSRA